MSNFTTPAQIIEEDEHEVTVITDDDRREDHQDIAARKLGTAAIHLTHENEWTTYKYRRAVSTSWRVNGHPRKPWKPEQDLIALPWND